MKVLLVGPGGWGKHFVELLLKNTDTDVVFEGIVARTSCHMREEVEVAGIPLYFTASHAVERSIPYTFCFEFEKATITNGEDGGYLATFKDGTAKAYKNPLSHGEEKVYLEDKIIVPTLTVRLTKAYKKECMLSEV